MRSLVSLFIFFLHLLSANCIYSQTQELKFNQVMGTNGITLGKINGMTRDKYGAMWFSDQVYRGIIRYDGQKMTRFQNDLKNPNSLGGFYPECVFADTTGIIWIGFYGMGLDRFDPETGIFTHYRHQPNNPKSLSNDTVTSVIVDHLGNIWVGNYGGLDLLDPSTGNFKHYPRIFGDTTSLSSNWVRAVYEDRRGELWVGCGMVWDNNKNTGGLNHFHRNSGTFTQYLADSSNPHKLINNKVRAIFEDSRGTLWVGTAGDGLHSLDRKTGLFERHLYDPANPEKLSRPPLFNAEDHITFITEDAERELWVGTLWSGLVRYNFETGKKTQFRKSVDSTGGYKDNSSWWAYASDDGLIWVSTQDSTLYLADLNINYIPNVKLGAKDDFINDFHKESNGSTWLATDNGLVYIDSINQISKRFVNAPGNKNSLSSNLVNSILYDQQGVMWLGTRGGLNRFDRKTGLFQRFVHDPNNGETISNNDVARILEDKDANLWLSTFGGGLNKFIRSTGKFISYRNDPADSGSISDNLVTALMVDESGDIWAGTINNGGVNRLSRQTGKFKRYLEGVSVGPIYLDTAGEIWVGGDQGLFRYHRKSDKFISIDEMNLGTPIEFVRSIIGDRYNNLWIATNIGIYMINPERSRMQLFGKMNNVNGAELMYGFYNQSQNDNVVLGSFSGYYSIDTKKIRQDNRAPKLYFTSFLLDGKLIKPSSNGPLKVPLVNAAEIKLGYNQNVFSFGFSSINFGSPSDNIIFFQLENYDNAWRKADADNRVSYFNVPPGVYTLRIKTSNIVNGIGAEKSIAIIISPPWWKTWWAYIIYAILLIGLAFTIHRVQRERVIKAERERTREKELAQAREIEKAYRELKTTQSQLIQQEKMASLGELTAGIAHEIQNPLNFVNNFSEVSNELIDEMNIEMEKGNLNEVKNISGHVKQNLEKIMHHGKRADAIVKGMLQHSQAGAGHKELVDINILADEYFRLAYHGLRAKDKSFNAAMKSEYDKNIGLVNIIPQDVGRVILNLITNAFYAVAEKDRLKANGYQPAVTVSTKRVDSNKKVEGAGLQSAIRNPQSVMISVKDNGNGIPQKVLDKIFQPFFTTKPAGQGTGLGLSLSYDIIKAHGGEIKVETQVGEGSVFTIQLPSQEIN